MRRLSSRCKAADGVEVIEADRPSTLRKDEAGRGSGSPDDLVRAAGDPGTRSIATEILSNIWMRCPSTLRRELCASCPRAGARGSWRQLQCAGEVVRPSSSRAPEIRRRARGPRGRDGHGSWWMVHCADGSASAPEAGYCGVAIEGRIPRDCCAGGGFASTGFRERGGRFRDPSVLRAAPPASCAGGGGRPGMRGCEAPPVEHVRVDTLQCAAQESRAAGWRAPALRLLRRAPPPAAALAVVIEAFQEHGGELVLTGRAALLKCCPAGRDEPAAPPRRGRARRMRSSR